ncbi:nicotinamide mononucleotide transporter [Streptomyces sp. IBSNAI002]|uniref:nicotinamide mononucleotide transporter n=1 Tax=Streptomyces sp. IBSNAI002 TaxID=3457500 RepID=UPI003FD11004
MNWLNNEALTVFGQAVIWSDLLGNTIGLVGLVLVIGMALWGWRQWRLGRQRTGTGVTVRFATRPERARLTGAAALGTIALGGVLTLYPSTLARRLRLD